MGGKSKSKSLESALRGIARDASEFRAIVKIARKNGWRVETTRNNHIKFLAPDNTTTIIASTTAGTNRAFVNLKAQLRKAGLTALR